MDRRSKGKDGASDDLSVDLLRQLFRSLEMFRGIFETKGVDTVVGPKGASWSLWDIERLYEVSQQVLPRRQAQAIRLFLVENMFEADAAEAMGLSRTNPIGMYATDGLSRIVALVAERRIRGFQNGGE